MRWASGVAAPAHLHLPHDPPRSPLTCSPHPSSLAQVQRGAIATLPLFARFLRSRRLAILSVPLACLTCLSDLAKSRCGSASAASASASTAAAVVAAAAQGPCGASSDHRCIQGVREPEADVCVGSFSRSEELCHREKSGERSENVGESEEGCTRARACAFHGNLTR
jgi:hypothetical protein